MEGVERGSPRSLRATAWVAWAFAYAFLLSWGRWALGCLWILVGGIVSGVSQTGKAEDGFAPIDFS